MTGGFGWFSLPSFLLVMKAPFSSGHFDRTGSCITTLVFNCETRYCYIRLVLLIIARFIQIQSYLTFLYLNLLLFIVYQTNRKYYSQTMNEWEQNICLCICLWGYFSWGTFEIESIRNWSIVDAYSRKQTHTHTHSRANTHARPAVWHFSIIGIKLELR